jgi:hypothetical protein
MAERQATVRVNGANRQAIKSPDEHFARLDWFVNRDLSVFLKPSPFRQVVYGAEERMNWYREQLRKVWAGQDPAGIRLMILLGLKKTPHWRNWRIFLRDEIAASEVPPEEIILDPTFDADARSWTEIVQRLRQAEPQSFDEDGYIGADYTDEIEFESFGLPEAKLMADWQRSAIRCEFETDFQDAIYCLMKDSWRAKVCPNCRKYFVAGKNAQVYCTTECYGQVKNKRSLDYYRKEGKAKRATRAKRR